MIGINVWEGVNAIEEARQFCMIYGIDGPVLLDDRRYAEQIGIRGVPCNVFVDADGTVIDVGGVTPESLYASTRRLLGPGVDIGEPLQL